MPIDELRFLEEAEEGEMHLVHRCRSRGSEQRRDRRKRLGQERDEQLDDANARLFLAVQWRSQSCLAQSSEGSTTSRVTRRQLLLDARKWSTIGIST